MVSISFKKYLLAGFLSTIFLGNFLIQDTSVFSASTPASCSTQTVYWGSTSPWASVACKGTAYGPTPSGLAGTAPNVTPGYTGTAKVSCDNGRWVVSGTCTPNTPTNSPATGSNPNTSPSTTQTNTPSTQPAVGTSDRPVLSTTPSAIPPTSQVALPISINSAPKASCPTQTIYWGANSAWAAPCKGIVYGPTPSGLGGTAPNTNPSYTGIAKVSCDNGRWVVASGTCTPAIGTVSTGTLTQTKEIVTCYFTGSTTTQKCYTSINNTDISCSGVKTCTVPVYGTKGTKLTWKSSLGGYGYTTLDGQNEFIVFAGKPAICPMYQIANPPTGCRIEYTKDTNGCSVPKLVCTSTGILTTPTCSTQYAPVCGQPCDLGFNCSPKTYINSCEMRKVGAWSLYDGACRTDSGPINIGSVSPMIKILNPSAGINGSWRKGDIIALNWEMQNVKESQLSVYIVDKSDRIIMSKALVVSGLRKIYNGTYLYEFSTQGFPGALGGQYSFALKTPSITARSGWFGMLDSTSTTFPWTGSATGGINTGTTTQLGEYRGYINNQMVIVTKDITKASSYTNCVALSKNNPKSSILCLWNQVEIFRYSPSPIVGTGTMITPEVRETVTCLFTGATTTNGICTTVSNGVTYSCSGKSSCSVVVGGKKGTQLTWKSNIGGSYRYTVIDGQNETTSFYNLPIPSPLPVVSGTGSVVCSTQYSPVCGQPPSSCPPGAYCTQSIPQPKTYSNRCEMEKAGAKLLYGGYCSTLSNTSPNTGSGIATIVTNGPTGRTMTAAELQAFQTALR